MTEGNNLEKKFGLSSEKNIELNSTGKEAVIAVEQRSFQKRVNPKNQMSRGSFLILVCFALLTVLSGCNKDKDRDKDEDSIKAEIYVLDISEETEWDYMVAGVDKSLLFVQMNDDASVPELITFSPNGNVDNVFTAFYKENGLPDIVCIDEYILVYNNFRGNLFDIAIINPNNTINYFFDIESDIDWNIIIESDEKALRSKSTGLIRFQHSLKFLSTSLSGIACATSGILTVGSFGALTPVMALSCGSFITSAISNYGFNSSNFGKGLNTTSTAVGHVGNLIGCAGGGLSCFTGLAADYLGAASTALEFANTQDEKINDAKEGLNENSTNSILGEWTCHFLPEWGIISISLQSNGIAKMDNPGPTSIGSGTWKLTENTVNIRLLVNEGAGDEGYVILDGTINSNKNEIKGNWKTEIDKYPDDNVSGTFIMNKN